MHGFEQVKYEVLEGETLNITFRRNVKGTTAHRRLSFIGSITSVGDKTGKYYSQHCVMVTCFLQITAQSGKCCLLQTLNLPSP